MLVVASGLLSTARRNGSSALCSLLDRLSQHFPLLSVRQMGTHYPVWLFEMEYFDGLGAFAPGPFLLLAGHVVLKGHALWIGFLEPGFGSIGVGGSCARSCEPVRRYRYMPRWWFSEILRQALEKRDGALSLRQIWHGTRFRPATPALPRFPCARSAWYRAEFFGSEASGAPPALETGAKL